MTVGKEVFGAFADPPDRLAQPFGGDGRQRVLAVWEGLGAETAPDIGRNDPHLFGRQLHHAAADDVADKMTALAPERERVPIAVVFRDDATGVEIIRDQPLVHDRQLAYTRGFGKGLPGRSRVAGRSLERQVSRPVRPHQWRAGLERIGGADDLGQRLPINLDGFRSVLSRSHRIGDHEGDRIADVAHGVRGENWIGGDFDIDAREHAWRRQRPEVADIIACQK